MLFRIAQAIAQAGATIAGAKVSTLGSEAIDVFFLEADATPNPGGVPIGGQTRLDIPNDHLQYAITWFAIALALAAVPDVVVPGIDWERTRSGVLTEVRVAGAKIGGMSREEAAGWWAFRPLASPSPPPIPDVPRIPYPVLVGVSSFLGIVSLAALIGIWTPR